MSAERRDISIETPIEIPTTVWVVSYFPGNIDPLGSGGFDFYPGTQHGLIRALDRLATVAMHGCSITLVQLAVPKDVVTMRGITDWLHDVGHLRELPAQGTE